MKSILSSLVFSFTSLNSLIMKYIQIFASLFFFGLSLLFAQPGGGPWNNPLRMAWSTDGITFGTTSIFQDSSGVPSVIRWKGDTLIAAFQWFRQPNPSPSWDRVATKMSFDKGITWTEPQPVIVNGLPTGFQRPFDPTLVSLGGDSLRIYYSSSVTMPMMGADSIIDTYSAVSTDGVNFQFENNPRVNVDSSKVIDPAVIYFNNAWHFAAPIGSPQQGAYHYISPNGVNFSRVPNISSDNTHNWTGNYMVENSTELRFYGSGGNVWYNHSANGGVWDGYVPTNIQGGDPSVVKIDSNNYLMIYVGQPYSVAKEELIDNSELVKIYPNPAFDKITINLNGKICSGKIELYTMQGVLVWESEVLESEITLDRSKVYPGGYIYRIHSDRGVGGFGKLWVE